MSNVKTAQHVNSVALTCDFLRAQPGPQGFSNFQFRNLAWLERIIGAQSTWHRWGVKTSVITAPKQPGEFQRSIANDAIFSDYLEDAGQAWASLYAADEFRVFPEILENLLEHDLVIGFELPPTLKLALHRAGKRYISFYIHPVRFLRDLCFLVTSNCNEISGLIAQNEVSPQEIYYQARRFSALFSRLELPAISLPENVPVLIGQTDRDSVLINNGKFTTWKDHEDDLSETLAPYSEVIFLEHPHRHNSAISTEYFRGRHGKTVISVRGNSYGVIFSQVVPPFFLTLASSLGAEARCAGRDCRFLSNDPCEKFLLNDVDVPGSIMVSHAVLQDDLWKKIFSGQFQKKKTKASATAEAFPLGDNFIRNSLESWAFRSLQSGTGFDSVFKQVLPSARLTKKRLDYISAALCAGAPAATQQVVMHGRTQQPWGTVQTLPKPFPPNSSSEIDFSLPSTQHYLVEGFHPAEGWGVWSSGKYAKLILPIGFDTADHMRIDISMIVKVFAGTLAQAPVLQITMAGQEVSTVLFRRSAKNDQRVYLTSRIDNPSLEIEFRVSHTASPSMMSQSTDDRELGFGICALNVSVSSVENHVISENGIEVPTKFWGVSSNELTAGGNGSAHQGEIQ